MPRDRMRRSSRSRSVVRLNQGLLRHLMPQSTFGSRTTVPVNASARGGFGAGHPGGGGGGGATLASALTTPPVGGPTPNAPGVSAAPGIALPPPPVPPVDTGQHPVYPVAPMGTGTQTFQGSGFFPSQGTTQTAQTLASGFFPTSPTSAVSLPPAFMPAYTYPKKKPTGVSEY